MLPNVLTLGLQAVQKLPKNVTYTAHKIHLSLSLVGQYVQ